MTTLNVVGYASTTEQPYDVGGAFAETVATGAFKRSLRSRPDVPLVINHQGLPLARTTSGTMTLTEDARGLRVDALLDADDPDVQALTPKMRRGDVGAMSMAFRAVEQTWNTDRSQRRILQAELSGGDVSIVNDPANPWTSVNLRHAVGVEQRERLPELVGRRVVTVGAIIAVDGVEIRAIDEVACRRCGDAGQITIACPNCTPARSAHRPLRTSHAPERNAALRQLNAIRTWQIRRQLAAIRDRQR